MGQKTIEHTVRKEACKERLEASAKRYHIIGAWVAIIFDPIFGITDYLNGIEGWEKILAFRFGVSLITFITVLFYKRYKFPNFFLVFVPFTLISCQNAFTYSLISLDNFTGHTLNYIALWIGAGLFILWNIRYSLAVVGISLIANIYFISIHTEFSLDDSLVNGGLLLIVVAIFTVILIEARYKLTIKTIRAQLALEKANHEIHEQKQIVEKKNHSIMDSIRYAQRIQNATLPQIEIIHEALPESFVLFKPRDVVSGDFYWFWRKNNKVLIAAMDCTGHGVPGAFMSMKGDALLNQIVNVEHITEPHLILKEMDAEIRKGLKQDTSQNKDGMDGTLCLIDFDTKKLYFTGAKNPLVYIQNGEIKRLKGDVHPIGGGSLWNQDSELEFTSNEIDLAIPTTFYIFSDGFQDQFGGKDGRKFMAKSFRNLLFDIHQKPMNEQRDILDKTITQYMEEGATKQIDDILVIGIKVD